LLAALLSRPGALVTAATLVEDLWGSAPPRSALSSLRSHVMRLRASLARGGEDDLLVTQGDAYRLRVTAEDIDAGRFEALVREAARLTDPHEAVACYDAALVLWRDEAYVEFGDAPFAVLERIRLAELRAAARERRTDLALSIGSSDDLVAELEQRVRAEPYRERGWEQLALALYRSSRQADALAACRRARQVLLDDLGVDPSPGLQALEQRLLRQDATLLTTSAPAPATTQIVDRCPYLGLAGYDESDAALFFGRERLTSALAGRLADQSIVVVIGASGVGKSSLVRAGLVPALRAGALAGSAAWRIDVDTPTGTPLANPLRRPNVLVLDQAEQLFTALDEDQRGELAGRLNRYVEDDDGRLVFVVRSDFFGRLTEIAALGAFAEKSAVLVGPMRDDELRRALVEPAAAAGLRLEDELIEVIMDDAAGQPEPLPLLSEAMVRTWQRRDGELLTLAGYQNSGELAGALEAAAEECYGRLDKDQQLAARHLLVRMATRTDAGWVRRAMPRPELLDATQERALAALVTARLVVADQQRLEVVHDALLAHWPRLREWLDERSLAADLLRHLDQAARDWRLGGGLDTDLYRGPRLSAALDWRRQHPEDLSAHEAQFLDASARAADAELTAARAQTRRLRSIAIALAAVVVLAAAAAVVAVRARNDARRQTTRAEQSALTADARRLAALSANAPDIATSSLLAVAAYRLQDTADSVGALLNAVERNQSALWELSYDVLSPQARPLRVATSLDGTLLAMSDSSQHVVVVDLRTRKRTARFSVLGTLDGFTKDGRQVIASGATDAATPVGEVAAYDVATGKRQLVTDSGNYGAPEPVLSTDDRWLATLTAQPVGPGYMVDVYDSQDLSARPRQFPSGPKPSAWAASRSSLAIEYPDGSVTVRDFRTLRVVGRLSAAAGAGDNSGIAITADGSRIARADSASPGRTVVYELPAGKEISQVTTSGTMSFAPDGTELAVGTSSGALSLYRVTDGMQVNSYAGHAGPLLGIAWTGTSKPTGLYTVGLDSKLISWNLAAGPRTVREYGQDHFPPGSPAQAGLFGSLFVGAGQDPNAPHSTRRIFTIDVRTGAFASWRLGLHDDEGMTQLAASRNGAYALASITGTVGRNAGRSRIEIYDLRTHRDLGHLHLPGSTVFADGYLGVPAPDGRRAYAQVTRTRIAEFALPSGRLLRVLPMHFAGPDAGRLEVNPWQFDPSGRLVVSGFDGGPGAPWGKAYPPLPAKNRLGLLDVTTGKLVAQTVLPGGVASTLAWSHDGRTLAVGGYDGTLTLYDARSLVSRLSAGIVSSGYVLTASFSPDDRLLALGGTDGTLSFFSAADLAREGQRIAIGDSANSGGVWAWYRPNGNIWGLAQDARSGDARFQRPFAMIAAPPKLAAIACALAGADITPQQWQRYVSDRPYRHVCARSR
jgi:DNA-binding SARP family transcriptional activator/WD40 repeat protein